MLRRCETCAGDVDEELLLQLKSWRLNVAKEQNVPAYVVFSDNTLIAIAELQPTDDAALIAILASARASSNSTGKTCCSWFGNRAEGKSAGQKIGCHRPRRAFTLYSAFR